MAELHRLIEKGLKDIGTKADSRLGQDAVVGYLFVKVVAQKPAVGEIILDFVHETALGSDAVEVANEQRLEEDNRVDGRLAGVAVVRVRQFVDEREVDCVSDAAKEVIPSNEPF